LGVQFVDLVNANVIDKKQAFALRLQLVDVLTLRLDAEILKVASVKTVQAGRTAKPDKTLLILDDGSSLLFHLPGSSATHLVRPANL
jgi:hypothetical protein